jgi:hypothetical protein
MELLRGEMRGMAVVDVIGDPLPPPPLDDLRLGIVRGKEGGAMLLLLEEAMLVELERAD